MIVIARITPQYIATFKEVRLRALRDTPTAFGSTYARESLFTDADWMERVDRWNGDAGIGFLALDDGVGCGIAGSLLDPGNPRRADLHSVWTAPAHRRRGIGDRLLNEVVELARTRGVSVLRLMVTSANVPAIRFYERAGFAHTGRTEPYRNDASLVEHEMLRPLA